MTSLAVQVARKARSLHHVQTVRCAVNRARRTGSTAASRVVDPLRRTPATSRLGEVRLVDDRIISGWVSGDPRRGPDEVAVFLNGIRAVRLPLVADPEDEARRVFRFKVRPLLRYARRTDRLTVRYAGETLPFAGTRTAVHRPVAHGHLPTRTLRRRLAGGEIFNSDGHLQQPKNADTDWQSGVLALYAQVREALQDAFGYDAFLIYGSLLGAVRDGGFIGHDTDLDAGYVSSRTNGPDAAHELADVALALIGRGLRVECRVVCLHVYDPTADGVHIDLFHTFFYAGGEALQFPWGVAGTSAYRREQWRGAHEIDFAGTRVLVPSEPETMAEAIYGAGWRVPDPGFSWQHDRTARDSTGRVPPKLNSAVNWVDRWARASVRPESSFAHTCLQRDDLPTTVVDLGCGDGRDSVAFARRGCTVVAVDAAATAIALAASRPDAAGVEFVALDLDDVDGLRRLVDTARNGERRVLFYAHRLFDALFEDTARALLAFVVDIARPGDAVAFASALTAPGDHPLRHRRPVDVAGLQFALAGSGFTTLHAATVDDANDGPVHQLISRRSETEEI
jgi:SAM-dependent methyltransferase